jgi:Single-stranded DNA-specific exonuclease
MKSINGVNWKKNIVPERLILKNKQDYNISYLLSKIFLDNKYNEEEIQNSIFNFSKTDIIYQNEDFKRASTFVIDCIKKKKKILIFGDYDVDGYSSTYLLYDYFSNINIDCDFYIPDRFLDGYGPNTSLLNKLINKKNYGLVFFVDCGSNSYDEIMLLESFGLKTIIIDHHQIHKKNKFKNTVIINP